MRAASFIALAAVFGYCSASTAGREFQLVFMENIVEAPQDVPLEVYVSNLGGQSATVTVSTPGFASCPSQTQTVNANSNVRFDVCWWMRLSRDDLWPTYKSILVSSNRDVMVYGVNKELYSSDGYYATPVDRLAYSYYVASYDEANIATQFAISATADCSVQVTLPGTTTGKPRTSVNYKGLVYTDGETFTMSLTQYETFQAQSRGDITGARIIADQPIAVWSGNVRNKADSGSRDHLVAMLQATGCWGTTYSVTPVPRSQNFGDIVRVISRRASTTFTITFESGQTSTQTLSSPGGFYEFQLNGPATITSNNANELQVIQMVRSQAGPRISDVADPVMFLVVSRNQWLNEYISPALTYTRSGNPYDRNYVYLSVSQGQQGGLRIGGNTIPSVSWDTINGIASAWVAVGSGPNRFTHNNNQPFSAMVYGASDRESYGFALGADLSNCGDQIILPPSPDDPNPNPTPVVVTLIMNDHSRDLFEDDSDCSSLNPVETSTPVRSVPPTMPGLATAISPTRPGYKRSKKHHLKEKRRQYRIKNMLSKKHQLSEASSHQVVAVSCKKEDDGSLGFGFSIEGVLNKVIRLYRNTQYDKNCQYIMQGDILLQIGKESFLTPGGANVYMKRCKVGQILTFFCQESLMMRGDGLDNDCDGSNDEESCNGVDDDNDGLIDEDCAQTSIEAFGNEYVIMFMENNVDDNPSALSFLEIYLSAVDSQATVTYTLETAQTTSTGTINPGEVEIFTNLDTTLRHTGSGIDTKAIIIKASADVVVYGINKQTWSTDGFLAFPVDVVGNEYYTAHYYPGTDLNEFAITPVINDGTPTSVTVTMPNNPTGSSANFGQVQVSTGQSTTFTLNYGETAQFQSASTNDDLNGARIVASRSVAVFSGNVRARVDPTTANSRDHLVQQLSPVSTWGLEFVTLPAPRLDDRGDVFFITASAANTFVTIDIKNEDGSATSTSVNIAQAGNYEKFEIGSRQYAHIQSNRPVQVYQYVKTTANKDTDNADPAMMLIPPVEQWSRNYQLATPRTGQEDGNGGFLPFDNFVMIAIDSAQTSGLRLDNAQLSNPTWIDLTGSSFAATVIQVAFGRHSLSHVDPNVYFEALMYGRSDRESFALPLGMRLVVAGCVQTTQVEGDNIDNDCDGSIDEELCNGIDDDADGSVDEDCGSGLSSGTSFYLTYMDNVVEYPQDFDLELYVAVVGSTPAIVSIRTPLYDTPNYNIMSEVQPGEVQQYGFTWRMRNTGQGITGNTVYVRANSEVVVYGVNKELFSNDGFLVYPETSLGTVYYTVSWSPSTLDTEFAVVATQDNTVVQITLPNRQNIAVEANGQTYGSGQNFQVTLQRFEAYQAQSAGDLSGTRIQSSSRTAVFSGNVRTLVELSASRDHLVQQMLPTTSYGTTFYVVPFPDRTVGDRLRIVAGSGNTNVRVNGGSIGTIGQAGGFLEYELNSQSRVEITATQAVMVVQFVKSQDGRDNPEEGDPAMFVVPSSSNFVNTGTFITPVYSGGNTPGSDYLNYLTLVIVNGQQGNLRLNGNALTQISWSTIAQSNYVTATIDVPSGQSHTIRTTSGATFYGRLYGRADRESYAFPIGFQFQ